MALVEFTPQLRRFVDAPSCQCEAATLREALDAAFAEQPRLRGYILDEQGHLRVNVVVFKIINEQNNWQGALRFLDKAGAPVKALKIKLSP